MLLAITVITHTQFFNLRVKKISFFLRRPWLLIFIIIDIVRLNINFKAKTRSIIKR